VLYLTILILSVEHPSSSPVFSGVRVTRSLVLCVCFVDRCLSFRIFFFWSLCCLITPLVIFQSGQPSHGSNRTIFEVKTLTLPRGTLASVASLLAATLYQGIPDTNHKLWNIVSGLLHTLIYTSKLTARST
jgi:hypothetical protein